MNPREAADKIAGVRDAINGICEQEGVRLVVQGDDAALFIVAPDGEAFAWADWFTYFPNDDAIRASLGTLTKYGTFEHIATEQVSE